MRFLKSAIHSEIFELDDHKKTWHFNENMLNLSNISADVAGLVIERIRGLSPLQQALIGVASIAGHTMHRNALQNILPLLLQERGINIELESDLNKLQTIELAYQEFIQKNLLIADIHCFRFFHDKIQEAAYSLLSDSEKGLLHPAYGLWSAQKIDFHQDMNNESIIFEAAYHICMGDRQQLSPYTRKFLLNASNSALKVYAFDKAKDYLYAIVETLNTHDDIHKDEKFEVYMTLANTLSISDQISAAMMIYDQLLEFDCTALQRADIYCKKSEYETTLFEYKKARNASYAGLDSIGVKIFTNEFISYLYIFAFLPLLIIYGYYFNYFGKQTKEIRSEKERLRFQLLLKNVVPQYLTQPIVAIANLLKLTFEILRYKDSDARASVIGYWAVACCGFGFYRFADMFYLRAYEYFDRTANPVNKGFILFTWGMIGNMPEGNLAGAQEKLEEAVRMLAPVGESFWRSTSLMGLILIDYFGGETGQAGSRSLEMIELWKKVGFAATIMGTTLRHFIEDERKEQVTEILEATIKAERKVHNEGFVSLDCVLAMLSTGEYYEMKGDYQQAVQLLRRATWNGIIRMHRSSYVTYSPIVLARSLIHQKKLFSALLPLTLCWLNQLLNVRLFLPQTLFMSGYWLHAFGCQRLGLLLIESGIGFANSHQWLTVAAEGQLLLGRLILKRKPDLALIYLQLAKAHFDRRNWKYHSLLCAEQIKRQKNIVNGASPFFDTNMVHTRENFRAGARSRDKIEVHSILEISLRLSSITDKNTLLHALTEALCQMTKSEIALIILKSGERWAPFSGFNIDINNLAQFNQQVDMKFLDKCTKANTKAPVIRNFGGKYNHRPLTSGSAMILPLIYDSDVLGYCYLAHSQIYEYYDDKSMEFALPLTIQGAITLQKISLNAQLLFERNQLSKLHQVLIQRVIEQTREIKSILQHINMGICTFSSSEFQINDEYSLKLENLLGESQLQHKPLLPLLFNHSRLGEDQKNQVSNALSVILGEPSIAFTFNEHLLPRALQGKTADNAFFAFELEWKPITKENDLVDRILLTINDVSAIRGLEERNYESNLEMQIILEIIGCSNREWFMFIKNCRSLSEKNTWFIQDIIAGNNFLSNLRKILVNLHTIKGNARALGCKLLNESIHEIETNISVLLKNFEKKLETSIIEINLMNLTNLILKYQTIAETILNRNLPSQKMIFIEKARLLDFYSLLAQLKNSELLPSEPAPKSLNPMRELLFPLLVTLFEGIAAKIEAFAEDSGKIKPTFRLILPNIWIDEKAEQILGDCFIPLLESILTHSIETTEFRLNQGKPAQGEIDIRVVRVGEFLEFRIQEDGRGLDLKSMRDIAIKHGLFTSQQAKNKILTASLMFVSDFVLASHQEIKYEQRFNLLEIAQILQGIGGSIHLECFDHANHLVDFDNFRFIITMPLKYFHFERIDFDLQDLLSSA